MCRYCQECERPPCKRAKRKRGEQDSCEEAESPFTLGTFPVVKDWRVIPGIALEAGTEFEFSWLAELLDESEAAEATGEATDEAPKEMLQILDEHSQ